jgi:hypothetical protein
MYKQCSENKLEVPTKIPYTDCMKIEIEISDQEIQDVIDTLKDQGVDITRAEVEAHYQEYFHGAVEDSQCERMDGIVDSIIDLQD